MQVIKIEYEVTDHKLGGNYHFTEIAANVDAAVTYLEKNFTGLVDVTTNMVDYSDNPPVRVYHHTKERVDEDGDWDYPRETKIELYFEEVIE
ncbi:hypothetical protein ENKO_470 [Klebsiella phage fENko-Kae01]|nr:hypothetical protein [Salmonella enterica]WNV47573.1 hypothetical protein [Klebsiella phage fENko-Kae01]